MSQTVVSPKSMLRWGLVVAVAALVVAGWLVTVGPTWADERQSYVITDADAPNVVFVGDGGSTYVLGTEGDESAYLGVQLREEIDHPEGGARITEVVEDSPAERAGLREGDIIVEFDGHVVRGPAALTKRIHAREAGDKVGVKVIRDGKSQRLEVELGSRSEAWAPYVSIDVPEITADVFDRLGRLGDGVWGIGADCDEDEEDCALNYFNLAIGRPKLGVQLVETTPELRQHLGGGEDRGVLVSKVLSNTPAERAGIRVGDLIVEVDGDEVGSTSELRRALHDKVGKTFDVVVIRDGNSRTISVTIPEPDDDLPTGPRAYVIRPGARAPAAVVAAPPAPRVALRAPRYPIRDAPSVVPAPLVRPPVPPAPVAPAPPIVPAPRIVPPPPVGPASPRPPAPPAPEASRVV